jgi:hypothetical protein
MRAPDDRASRRPQDLQAVRRRRVPPLRVRPVLRGHRPPTARSWPTPPARPARTSATPSSPPARRSPAGPPRPPTTAARCSTASPRCWRAAAASSSPRSADAEGLTDKPRCRAQVDAAIDRWVWYAGLVRQVRAGHGDREPGRRPLLQPLRPEPTGVVAASRRRLVAARAGRRLAPIVVSGNTVVVVASDAGRCPPSPSPRCWRPRTCPAGSSTSSPATPTSSPPCSPATSTSTRST